MERKKAEKQSNFCQGAQGIMRVASQRIHSCSLWAGVFPQAQQNPSFVLYVARRLVHLQEISATLKCPVFHLAHQTLDNIKHKNLRFHLKSRGFSTLFYCELME